VWRLTCYCLSYAIETTDTLADRQRAYTEYHRKLYEFTVIVDKADEPGGKGSLRRIPRIFGQPLRRIVAADRVVETVMRLHLEFGHGTWDTMQEEIQANYFSIAPSDVE
jgi:hypothetical protein